MKNLLPPLLRCLPTNTSLNIAIGGTLVACLVLYGAHMLGFTDQPTGERGAMAAEKHTIEAAFHRMMSERGIARVVAHNSKFHQPVKDWSNLPAGPGSIPLSNYLYDGTSIYYYCWDSRGHVNGAYRDDKSTCADKPD